MSFVSLFLHVCSFFGDTWLFFDSFAIKFVAKSLT